jgi:hypothetical protein
MQPDHGSVWRYRLLNRRCISTVSELIAAIAALNSLHSRMSLYRT